MKIIEIEENKKHYLELLLLGDEQESMIDRYLESSSLYVLFKERPVGLCVVSAKSDSVLEIKNIAVYPEFQRLGYGSRLIEFIENKYSPKIKIIRLSTGDSPRTISFYESNGFTEVGREKDYFIRTYDHPIYECGKLLTDLLHMEKKID